MLDISWHVAPLPLSRCNYLFSNGIARQVGPRARLPLEAGGRGGLSGADAFPSPPLWVGLWRSSGEDARIAFPDSDVSVGRLPGCRRAGPEETSLSE